MSPDVCVRFLYRVRSCSPRMYLVLGSTLAQEIKEVRLYIGAWIRNTHEKGPTVDALNEMGLLSVGKFVLKAARKQCTRDHQRSPVKHL